MSDIHEPREAFVTQLADQLSLEIRRRLRSVPTRGWRGWLLASPYRAVGAATCVVVLSMAFGGGVVVAAYQFQESAQRDALISTYSQRLSIATQVLGLATAQLQAAEQRVSMGLDDQETIADARVKVAEAQANVHVADLDLAEIRASGRDPVDSVSAPLVSGRDFETERLRTQMTVPATALEAEQAHLAAAQRKVSVGIGSSLDVESARLRVVEVQLAVAGFQKRLDIRQRFLRHEIDAAMADLLSLENDATLRRQTLLPRVEQAQRLAADTATRVQNGLAQSVDLAEAQLHLQELQFELKKAEFDLAVIQQRIQQYRAR